MESDYILHSWLTLKLLSNNGIWLTKSWLCKPSGYISLIKLGDIHSNVTVNDEPHNLFELPYFDQSVKVFRTGSN